MIAAFSAVLAFAVGCSGGGTKKIVVRGTVTYNGQPLDSGMLQLAGPNGAYAAAAIKADGTYEITDVTPGETKVAVQETPRNSGSSSGGKHQPLPKEPPKIPAKFRDVKTSGVTVTITPSTSDLPIELK
ncbi:MAG TPA: hypothetical protein VH092_36680 [Urbifossiella sp.]|nr:hypothetical protein [Urbifossiella sp.]